MTALSQRHKAVVERFQELLRCGKDYSVRYMYEEAAKVAYLNYKTVEGIVNNYYRSSVTEGMINFINNTPGTKSEKEKLFSEEFSLCIRESVLIIRYIKMRRNG